MTGRSPQRPGFSHRIATPEDSEEIKFLINLAIGELQKGFLSPEQIAVSRSIMELDPALIADGTYFLIYGRETGRFAASGGWSLRAAL